MKWIVALALYPICLFAKGSLPRTVIGFWDSIVDKTPDNSLIHITLEMPLNHLGIDVVYYDIQKPLPDVSNDDSILGVLLCFNGNVKMADPKGFIEWNIDAIHHGKKIVIMGNPGFITDYKGLYTSGDVQNRLFEKIGFTTTQTWVDYPYDYQILSHNNEIVPFEREYPSLLNGFYLSRVLPGKATSYLQVGVKGRKESLSDLIVIGPNGAYVSEFYANNYQSASTTRAKGWYINPFVFFEKVFCISRSPIPDTTTLAGKRIFHVTCHGDNWNTQTSIEAYRNKEVYCSEVILEKIILPNPDIPISVGVVAADVDPAWVVRKKSVQIVKRCFSLPQVIPASHTYSHPFDWEFFHTGGKEKEIQFLHRYPYGSWQSSFLSWFHAKSFEVLHPKNAKKSELNWGYVTPRAYANEPFNLDKEIKGSIDFLNQFTLPNKKIDLLIWSGDSRPWDTPLILCSHAHVQQFGGGFVRFDHEYPSNIFVYPLGRKPGGQIQVYASSNAENNYTNNWSDHFFAFQQLPLTYQNTESPRRIKPLHLYFHSFSGQFLSSVNAILSNIAFIREQNPIAISTVRYCTIAQGFYSIEIEPCGNNAWKVKNRKGLQTLRFDHIDALDIDYTHSHGVIGAKVFQDSLYVYLDASVEEPLVALQDIAPPTAAYLIASSWEIENLTRKGASLHFMARGWGDLSMQWKMPQEGSYRLFSKALNQEIICHTEKGILNIDLVLPYDTLADISIEKEGL